MKDWFGQHEILDLVKGAADPSRSLLSNPAGDLSLTSCPSGQDNHYRDQIDSPFVSDEKTGQAEGVAGLAVHKALPFSSHGTSEVTKSVVSCERRVS